MRTLITTLILLLSLPLLSSDSHAGRRAFGWTFDTETLHQGDFEIEQWLWGKDISKNAASGTGPSWVWFGMLYGLNNYIELAFPWEMVITETSTRLTNFTGEIRARVFPRSKKRRFDMLIRLFYQHNLDHPFNAGRFHKPWLGANLVFSFGRVRSSHATLDIGGYMDAVGTKQLARHTLGLGYTHRVNRELRLGAEYVHEFALGSIGNNFRHFFLGPSIAFSRGQFWMTLSVPIGLVESAPKSIPRLLLGVNI